MAAKNPRPPSAFEHEDASFAPGTVSAEEAEAWTLVDEDGNEFITTSSVAFWNLTAQGYVPKDSEAAAKLTAKMEEKASDPAYAKAADPTTYRSARR